MINHSIKEQEVWDENWDRNAASPSTLARQLDLPDSLAWGRIISDLKAHFGSISNLKVIEIGAGLGRAGARLAKEGADVTLIDFSPMAIQKAKDFFGEAGLKANFLVSDIFALPDKLKNSFDISVSFGLVEHFKKEERQRVFSIHAGVLKKGGVGIIGTPNAWGIPYILWMTLAKIIGAWEVGYERPYTAREIKSIMRDLGFDCRRWGTPFSETINTYVINKLNIVLTNLSLFGRFRAGDKSKEVHRFIPPLKDRWSALDNLFGYHIVSFYK